MQLELTVCREDDVAWMRERVVAWKLHDVTDRHLADMLVVAGDRQLVVDAIACIVAGRTHEGLRRKLEAASLK